MSKVILLTAPHPKRRAMQKIPIDQQLTHELAVGSLLGDGALVGKKGKTPCLEIEQKSPTYVMWKRSLFEKAGIMSTFTPRAGTKYRITKLLNKDINLPLTWKAHIKNQKWYRGFSFTTRALFSQTWRNLFYKSVSGKKRARFRKRIPDEIKDLFWSSLSLTIWFLDDGWWIPDKKTVAFSTEEWPIREVKLLIETLRQNFGIESTVYFSKGQPHHIYVHPNSYPIFFNNVDPYLAQFRKVYPRYAVSTAMKNKIAPSPLTSAGQRLPIGRPKNTKITKTG